MDGYIFLCLRNIFRKSTRSVLTMLGVAIGVCSVIIINAVSDAGQTAVCDELNSLGLNSITVKCDGDILMDDSDVEIIRNVNGVIDASSVNSIKADISNDNNESSCMIWSLGQSNRQIIEFQCVFGRNFSNADHMSDSYVCMIDTSIANKLFGRDNVVGKSVALSFYGYSNEFLIIGVTETESSIMHSLMSNVVPGFVYIPDTTFQSISPTEGITNITVKTEDGADVDNISAAIEKQLTLKRSENVFNVENLSAQRDILENLLSIVKSVFFAVGIITLCVSGLGIMTVMTVSVNERKREIGIKKAIGARFYSIMLEFLFEALMLSLFGAVVGLSFAFMLTEFAKQIFGIVLKITGFSISVSVICAIVSGIVFGMMPAYKAAKLTPSDALRE